MFFKKEEGKEEVQQGKPQEVAAERKVKPANKTIYRIEDSSGAGDWSISPVEVSKEHPLAANEHQKILSAQQAILGDISIRIEKLKDVRTRIKAVRKSAPSKAST